MGTPNHTTDPLAAHRMLTRAEAAEFLKVSVPTLERWAGSGTGPKCVRVGPRRVGYPVGALLAFVEQPAA